MITGFVVASGKISEQIQRPVVAAHEIPWRVFVVNGPAESESEFPANGVRWAVIHRRKGMKKPMPACGARFFHNIGSCHRGHSTALKFRKHAPASFPNEIALPLSLPKSV